MADPKKENQEKERQMDEMLDSLLAAYSSAEPRPGLETRILASLRDAPSREASPSWRNFKWLWAGAAVAAAIIVAVLLIGGRRHVAMPTPTVVQMQQPVTPQPEIQPVGPETANTIPASRRKRGVPSHHQNANLALSQRPRIFPTPTPLSEQEQLLLRYVAGTPREEVVAQSHPDEPPVSGQDQTEAIPDLSHVLPRLGNTR